MGGAPLRFANPGSLALDGAVQADATPRALPSLAAAKTVSFWMRPTRWNSLQVLVSLYEGTGAASIQQVQISTRFGEFGVFNPGGAATTLAKAPAIPKAGDWHHIAYVFDGTEHRLFLNGALAGSSRAGVTDVKLFAVRVGRSPGNYGEMFEGQIDDLRIYGRALQTGEVGELAAGVP
jgi:hypothetical protein